MSSRNPAVDCYLIIRNELGDDVSKAARWFVCRTSKSSLSRVDRKEDVAADSSLWNLAYFAGEYYRGIKLNAIPLAASR